MTVFQAFVREVEANYAGGVPIYIGPADAPQNPFIAVLVVNPNNETPDNFGNDQGEGGELTMQWSLAAQNMAQAFDDLEVLKNVVQSIRGVIGTAPDSYWINANRTGGVTQFDAQLGTWSAVFDATITWTKEV